MSEDDENWTAQLERFVADVSAWTGNPCAVIEYSRREFDDLLGSGQRLANDLGADAIALTGQPLPKRARKVRSS